MYSIHYEIKKSIKVRKNARIKDSARMLHRRGDEAKTNPDWRSDRNDVNDDDDDDEEKRAGHAVVILHLETKYFVRILLFLV